MKHLKRILAVCLCLFLFMESGAAAMPKFAEWFTLKASAAGNTPWTPETNDFDVQAELYKLKDDKTGKAYTWHEIGDPKNKHTAKPWDLQNWQEKYWKLFTSTDPANTYIKLVGDIGYHWQPSVNGMRNDDAAGRIWDRATVIKSSKVIDLNGCKFAFKADAKGGNFTRFYVTGPNTTVVIMDSSKDQSGLIWFYGGFHDTDTVYQTNVVRNLFSVQNGATLYVMGGNYSAGGMKLEDIETKWAKFKRIACSILNTTLTLSSAALSVFTSVASGGLGGDASGALNKVGELLNMGSDMLADVQTDNGKGGANAPKVTDPSNGNKTLEADTEDTDGRNAAAVQNDAHADANSTAGKGASVLVNLKGVYTVINKDGADAYLTQSGTGAKVKPKHEKGTKTFNYGDEVSVIGNASSAPSSMYAVKDGDKEVYMFQTDLKETLGLNPADYPKPFPADRISLQDSLLLAAQQQAENTKKDKSKPKVQDVVKAVKDGDLGKVADTLISTYGELTADKGKFYQVHWGTLFKVTGGSTVVIYNGTFLGYGQDGDKHNDMIQVADNSKMYIIDGTFRGMCGSNIFNENIGANVQIRGGTFDCSSVNVVRVVNKKEKDGSPGEYTYSVGKAPGVRGTINATIESYGREFVQDGRLQLTEPSGAGNLILKNTDRANGNKIVYSLYCAEADLPNISNLTVTYRESEYMANTFKLIGDAEDDGILEGKEYITYVKGDEHAYVAPKINGETQEAVFGDEQNIEAIENAIFNSGVWYYNFPRNDFIRNLRYTYTETNGTSAVTKNCKLLTMMQVYEYTLHQIDPVTQENVGEPLAIKTVSSASILTGQIRMIPSTGQSDGNTYYLMEKDKWQPGCMYRVSLTVKEYLNVGRSSYYKSAASASQVRVDADGISSGSDAHVLSTTSLVIRCRDKYETEFTPLQFTDTALGVGDVAQVNFLNAQVGRIDIYGQKLFSVTYDWRVKGYDDLHLVTTTRKIAEGGGSTYTVNGRVYDDHTIKWGQTETVCGVREKNVTTKGTGYLGVVKNAVPTSTKPYYSSYDSFEIPASVEYHGETLSLVGKQIYCEVYYGLCYNRWSRAFKYLPICDYDMIYGTGKLPEITANTVRETLGEKKYTSAYVTVRAKGHHSQEIDFANEGADASPLRMCEDGYYHMYAAPNFNNKVPCESTASILAALDACDEIRYVRNSVYNRIKNGETVIENGVNNNAVIELAKELSQDGTPVPVFYRQQFNWFPIWDSTVDKNDPTQWATCVIGRDSVFVYNDYETSAHALGCSFQERVVVYQNGKFLKQLSGYTTRYTPAVIMDLVEPYGFVGEYMLYEGQPERNGSLDKLGWCFDFATNTLTLKNLNWDNSSAYANHVAGSVNLHNTLIGFDKSKEITVNLIGNNVIKDWVSVAQGYMNNLNFAAIFAKSVRITGAGSLEIQCAVDASAPGLGNLQRLNFVHADSLYLDGTGTVSFKFLSNAWNDPDHIQTAGFLNTRAFTMTDGVLEMTEDKDIPGFWNWFAGADVNFFSENNERIPVPQAYTVADECLIKAGESKETAVFKKKPAKSDMYASYQANHKHVWTTELIEPVDCDDEYGHWKRTCRTCGLVQTGSHSFVSDCCFWSYKNDEVYFVADDNPQVDYYEIYRSETKDGVFKKIGTAKTEFTDKKVKGGSGYFYKVKAVRTRAPAAELMYEDVWFVPVKKDGAADCAADVKTVNVEKGKSVNHQIGFCDMYENLLYACSMTINDYWEYADGYVWGCNIYDYRTDENKEEAAAAAKASSISWEGVVPLIGVYYELEQYDPETGEWTVVLSKDPDENSPDQSFSIPTLTADVTLRTHLWADVSYFYNGVPFDPAEYPYKKTVYVGFYGVESNVWPYSDHYEGYYNYTCYKALEPTEFKHKIDIGRYDEHNTFLGEAAKTHERAYAGEKVTFTFSAGFNIPDGKAFDRWEVKKGGVTLDNPASGTATFVMGTQDVLISAVYKDLPANHHRISVDFGTPGAYSAANGTQVTVTAIPQTGKVFDKWVVYRGGVTLADATRAETTFVMGDQDVSITATYRGVGAGEHIVYVENGVASKSAAPVDAYITVTADEAPDGMMFDKWEIESGDVVIEDVSQATATFAMPDSDVKLKATYKPIPKVTYSVTVINGTASAFTFEGDIVTVTAAEEGDIIMLEADEPPAGKEFDAWEVVSGGISIADPSCPYVEFEMLPENVEIKANYKDIVLYSVTVTSGTASVNSAAKGTTVTVTAAAAPSGQTFDKWVVVKGGVTLADATKATTTFVMGDQNVEIEATYKDLPPAQHSVTVTSGTASVNSAAKGTTVTVTANAAPSGQTFDKWVVVKGGVTLADAAKATTTFVMGDADVEVKATYKALPPSEHAITVTSGTASVNSAAKGTTVTVTAAAAPSGQTFDKWIVVKGGVKLADAAKATTTFVMGDADVEVKATYKAAGSTEPEFMLGDVDGSGKVDTADARFALRRAIDLEKYAADSREYKACDVDKNGKVETRDARFILRHAIGLVDPEIAW